MAGLWDTPPTAEELAAVRPAVADPWASPPTPEEMGQVAPARPGLLRQAADQRPVGGWWERAWDVVKPGQYAAVPDAAPQAPGESDKAAALRGAHEGFAFLRSPEGLVQATKLLGYTMPGADRAARTAPPAPGASASVAGGSAGASSGATSGGAAGAQSGTTVIIRPPKRTLAERVLMEPAPIPEAQYLLGKGVPLTKGLYDPKSGRALVEMAETSRPGAGPLIMKQRGQALDAALDLGFREAAPPGWNGKLTGDINQKYSTLKSAWDEAYDAIRASGEQVYPAVHDGKGGIPLRGTPKKPGLLDQIIGDQGEIWDRESRAIAKRFMDNQMSRLPTPQGALGRVDIGDMLTVLAKTKQAGRDALRAQKYDQAQIFGKLQDAIEQAVESQATPQTSAALRALNSKYRDFKVIEDAVVRAGDSPAGITPARLAAAVKGAEPSRSRYAAGGGGAQRELSQAISTVFDESAMPRTGARLLAAAPNWAHSGLIGPTIYLRNAAAANATTNAAANAAAGGAAGGSAAANAPGWLAGLRLPSTGRPTLTSMSPQVAAMLRALGKPGLAPVAAEEEGP